MEIPQNVGSDGKGMHKSLSFLDFPVGAEHGLPTPPGIRRTSDHTSTWIHWVDGLAAAIQAPAYSGRPVKRMPTPFATL